MPSALYGFLFLSDCTDGSYRDGSHALRWEPNALDHRLNPCCHTHTPPPPPPSPHTHTQLYVWVPSGGYLLKEGHKCMPTSRRLQSANLSHMHVHCTHKHAFIYADAWSRYAYGAFFPHTHTPGAQQFPGPIRQLNYSDSVWSCLTVGADRRLCEVKHTHLPQTLSMINTNRTTAEWKLDWTKMNQIDSEWRGRTCFRGNYTTCRKITR